MLDCHYCAASFDDRDQRTKHRKEEHQARERGKGECVICNKPFSSIFLFQDHIEMDHPNETKTLSESGSSSKDVRAGTCRVSPWMLEVAYRVEGKEENVALTMDEMIRRNRLRLMQMGYESDSEEQESDGEEEEEEQEAGPSASDEAMEQREVPSPAPTEAYLDEQDMENVDEEDAAPTEAVETKPIITPFRKQPTAEEIRQLQLMYSNPQSDSESESERESRKRKHSEESHEAAKRQRGLSARDQNIPQSTVSAEFPCNLLQQPQSLEMMQRMSTQQQVQQQQQMMMQQQQQRLQTPTPSLQHNVFHAAYEQQLQQQRMMQQGMHRNFQHQSMMTPQQMYNQQMQMMFLSGQYQFNPSNCNFITDQFGNLMAIPKMPVGEVNPGSFPVLPQQQQPPMQQPQLQPQQVQSAPFFPMTPSSVFSNGCEYGKKEEGGSVTGSQLSTPIQLNADQINQSKFEIIADKSECAIRFDESLSQEQMLSELQNRFGMGEETAPSMTYPTPAEIISQPLEQPRIEPLRLRMVREGSTKQESFEVMPTLDREDPVATATADISSGDALPMQMIGLTEAVVVPLPETTTVRDALAHVSQMGQGELLEQATQAIHYEPGRGRVSLILPTPVFLNGAPACQADKAYWTGQDGNTCPRCGYSGGAKQSRKIHYRKQHYDIYYALNQHKFTDIDRWLSIRLGAEKDNRVCLLCTGARTNNKFYAGRTELVQHLQKDHLPQLINMGVEYQQQFVNKEIQTNNISLHNLLVAASGVSQQ